MTPIRWLGVSVAVIALTGCAHGIVISPDLTTIQASGDAKPIAKNVGYYISDEQRSSEVTTEGGGGDKVSYHPYRDTETAFYKMLSNVFTNVTVLKSANDADELSKNNVVYVIKPTITTESSSPSPFTWPPTKFTVNLGLEVDDAKGQQVVTKQVAGQGAAEFDEFKHDFSLSGRRASQDALLKMQGELQNAPELKK